ncbi:MAG: hypothetical protein HKP58_12960 [Desulfatitalea sp.]|nr:hypothetical protein [Desulfatitalea sp.]NNK01309.1 hypothetical protein [Desulfatitalea sp.]
MTASEQSKPPDFFEEHRVDPVSAVTASKKPAPSPPKKKAGFYLTESLLNRLDRSFHEMKLAGVPIENKSALVEKALIFALNDLEMGQASLILKGLVIK